MFVYSLKIKLTFNAIKSANIFLTEYIHVCGLFTCRLLYYIASAVLYLYIFSRIFYKNHEVP